MSLFNLIASPSRIVACADTAMATRTADGEYGFSGWTSKLWPVPHLRSILIGRGNPGVILHGVVAAGIEAKGDDIADVAKPLGDILTATLEDYGRAAAAWGTGAVEAETSLELVLAGYSARRGDCIAYLYHSAADTWAWPFQHGAGGGPGAYLPAGTCEKYSEVTLANALAMAREQHDSLPEDMRSYGVGGPLTACEIDATGITLTNHPALT